MTQISKAPKKKKIILDTNILLQDPDSLFAFEENDVCIPLTVLSEIDNKKTGLGILAFNAREVVRKISVLFGESERGLQETSLSLGEGLGNLILLVGGKLPSKTELEPLLGLGSKQLARNRSNIKELKDSDKKDDNILYEVASYVLSEMVASPKSKTEYIFITKDLALRIRASALGLNTEDYKKNMVDDNFLLKRSKVIVASDEMISQMYSADDDSSFQRGVVDEDNLLKNNERAILKSSFQREDDTHGTPVYKDAISNVIIPIEPYSQKPWGVSTKGNDQDLALNALLDEKVKLVVLIGPSGCGKTFLSLAAGLEYCVNQKKYQQLLVSKPVVPVGKQDIGYLPGTLDEKMAQWFGSVYDNFESLAKYKNTKGKNYWQELKNFELVDFLPLHSLRGRSISNKFIILDECQNLSPHEIKTFVSRVGENTKVVIMGDPSQIDAPYLDSKNNGLVYLVEAFENDEECQSFFSVCYFSQSQRSQISKAANRLL